MIHFSLPEGKSPATAIDFMNNIVSVTAKQHSSDSITYTLTPESAGYDTFCLTGVVVEYGMEPTNVTVSTFFNYTTIIAPGETENDPVRSYA